MVNYSNSYQKLFKAALATAVATGALVAVAPVNVDASTVAFKDVKAGNFYYEAVLDLSARGIINGYTDGTFRPGQEVTRGQAAQIIASTLGLDTRNVKNPGFKDVRVTDPFYGAIAALETAGILKGFTDNTYRPSTPLTRGQMSIILTLAFDLEKQALTDTRFTDVAKTNVYAQYIQALLTNKITEGMTATTFAPGATVTRGQMAAFIARSEAASSVKTEVINVTADKLVLSTGTYPLPASLKTLFSDSNLAALKGAILDVKIKDNAIVQLNSIELKANGNATSNVVLDGQGLTFAGNLIVNGDYVTVKNATIKGNLVIGNNVKKHFQAEKVTVEGKTIISDKAAVQAAAVAPATQIVILNSTLNTVEASNKSVTIDARGTTKVQEFVLSSDVLLKADKGVVIAKVTIQNGASAVTIDADVQSLVVNSTSTLVIDGSGKISKLEIKSRNAKLTLGANMKIVDLILPAGVDVKDVILNYDKVKGNIEKVGGTTNPDAKPTAPGAGGGGGGGGGGTSDGVGGGVDIYAAGNASLNGVLDGLRGSGNGVVEIGLAGKAFTVVVKDTSKNLGDFKTEAGILFEDLKSSIIVNSGSVNLGGGVSIPVTIDGPLDFTNLITSALKLVGAKETTTLDKLQGKSISFTVTGTIDNKPFSDTYSFSFQ